MLTSETLCSGEQRFRLFERIARPLAVDPISDNNTYAAFKLEEHRAAAPAMEKELSDSHTALFFNDIPSADAA